MAEATGPAPREPARSPEPATRSNPSPASHAPASPPAASPPPASQGRATPTAGSTGPAGPGPGLAPVAPAEPADALRVWRAWIAEEVRAPLARQIRAYADELLEAVQALPAPDPGPSADVGTFERFLTSLETDLLERPRGHRSAVFDTVRGLAGADPGLPERVRATPADAAPPEPLVQPDWRQRVDLRLRPRRPRELPAARVGRLYAAETAHRLESVLNRVGRLESLALDAVRARLHAGPEAVAEPATALGDEADAALMGVEGTVREVTDAVERALAAPTIRVLENDVENAVIRAHAVADRTLDGWVSVESALFQNIRSEAVLRRALSRLQAEWQVADGELTESADRDAADRLERLADGLRDVREEAGSDLEEGGLESLDGLRQRADTLFRSEADGLVESLTKSLREAAGGLVERLAAIPPLVPDELSISEQSIPLIPPSPQRIELRDAPVDELFRGACVGAIPRWLDRRLRDVEEELAGVDRELRRLRNAVDFHLRAPAQGGMRPADARDLVLDILARTADQIDALHAAVAEQLTALSSGLERRVAEESEAIRSAVAERSFLRIRSGIAEEQAVRRVASGLAWSRRLMDSAMRLGRRGWGAGRTAVHTTREWTRRQLGTAQVEREQMLTSLERSLMDEQTVAELPPLYRQLFDVEGEVPWEELLVPRDAELDTCRRAYDRWQRGQAATVALIGEKGSGKTTLLRLALRRVLLDHDVHTRTLVHTVRSERDLVAALTTAMAVEATSLDELTDVLKEGEPRVMVLEDAHHLFLRALDGFEILEAFLQLVIDTQHRVFWIVSIDEYAWNYLDRAIGLSPHFTHEINTTNLPAERLEAAVMARHQVSGYGLEFETTGVRESGLRDRLLGREPEGELASREARRRIFFRELNQIAEGNIFLALFYWLRSIHRVSDHALVLTDPELVDVEFLERLPLPALHTIAAIIIHGGLSVEEHQRVFQLTGAESRLQLASLEDSHLVHRSARDGEYKINKVLYRPFIRLLRSKNIF